LRRLPSGGGVAGKFVLEHQQNTLSSGKFSSLLKLFVDRFPIRLHIVDPPKIEAAHWLRWVFPSAHGIGFAVVYLTHAASAAKEAGLNHVTAASVPPATLCVYTAANQIDHNIDPVVGNNLGSPVQYDSASASGNVVADLQNGVVVHSYLYDGEGRICAVQLPPAMAGMPNPMIQYLYGAEGKRIGKGTISVWSCNIDLPNGFQLTNEYVLGQGGEQVSELDGSGNWMHTNAYVGGQLLATLDPVAGHSYDHPAVHYQLADWLGTRRMQVSPIGTLEETCQSLPFGDELNCVPTAAATSDDATEHHFTGKERDSESGNDYFEARYLASSMGRFSSPDPSGLYFADQTNPQSFNLYAYVRNNPLINTDPTGLDCIYIDPDSGEYQGYNRGDCDNSTTARANAGNYVNGTLTSLSYDYQSGNYSFQYNPYDQDPNTSTFGTGIIAGNQPETGLPLNITLQMFSYADAQTTPGSGFVHSLWNYGNYAGAGGCCSPIDSADTGALAHDYCYASGQLSMGENLGGAHNSALQACNQALCDTEATIQARLDAKANANGAHDPVYGGTYGGLSQAETAEWNAATDMIDYFTIVPFRGHNGCHGNRIR
jgi:RHS repeat-associated protein